MTSSGASAACRSRSSWSPGSSNRSGCATARSSCPTPSATVASTTAPGCRGPTRWVGGGVSTTPSTTSWTAGRRGRARRRFTWLCSPRCWRIAVRTAGQRVLSPASVATMSRSQLPARVPTIFPSLNRRLRAGGDGPARWRVWLRAGGFAAGDRFSANGSFPSTTAFGHVCHGRCWLWLDPERELVGVRLSVSPRPHRDFIPMNSDLFMNAVHATVPD